MIIKKQGGLNNGSPFSLIVPVVFCAGAGFHALRSATKGSASGNLKPLKRLERNFEFWVRCRVDKSEKESAAEK